MNKYNSNSFTKMSFAAKLQAAIDYKYQEEEPGKRRAQFVKEYDELYKDVSGHSISSTVQQWMSCRQGVTVERLMNVCNILDCDVDYFLTDQEEFKKEIASAAEITGLPYEAIDRIRRFGKKKHYSEIVDFQFLKLLLSSDEIFENVVSCLSTLVFTMDNDECFEIQTAYDLQVEDNGYDKCFVDATDLEPYCFNYAGRIYAPEYSGAFGFGAVSFELIQELTKLKEKEKKYREEHKNHVKVLVDWEKPEDNVDTEQEEEDYKKCCNYIETVKSRNMKVELKRVNDWKREEI